MKKTENKKLKALSVAAGCVCVLLGMNLFDYSTSRTENTYHDIRLIGYEREVPSEPKSEYQKAQDRKNKITGVYALYFDYTTNKLYRKPSYTWRMDEYHGVPKKISGRLGSRYSSTDMTRWPWSLDELEGVHYGGWAAAGVGASFGLALMLFVLPFAKRNDEKEKGNECGCD
ncbi:hypothetical protein D3C80_906170 [compost metagenome]